MKRARAGIVAALVEVESPITRMFRDHSTPEGCGCGERAEANASLHPRAARPRRGSRVGHQLPHTTKRNTEMNAATAYVTPAFAGPFSKAITGRVEEMTELRRLLEAQHPAKDGGLISGAFRRSVESRLRDLVEMD